MHSALPFAQTEDSTPIFLHPAMLNRHGLISGATGSGKTVTLQSLAEQFSQRGIAVFLADVKGDLSGLAQPPEFNEKFLSVLKKRHLPTPCPSSNPVAFWDVLQESGIPLRASISDLGPLLLSRLMGLTETQASILQMLFRIADEENLLLIDLKDLKALVNYVIEHLDDFKEYGHLPIVSLRAIARNLINLESLRADLFFGEPALDIQDLLRPQNQKGVIHILSAEKLIQTPPLYAAFLLWLLSSLYESLPETGDLPHPKLVFFFDEAHLLFKEAPPVLLEKVEQVVRLIRSKGVGVWFVTQNPVDIPDSIAGQLGNRIQHALRAFTPKDQKAVKIAAQSLRPNPAFKTEEIIGQLKTGEALVSCLNAEGEPQMVARAFIYPPASFLGRIKENVRQEIIQNAPLFPKYSAFFDRFSAYEALENQKERALNDSSPSKKTPKSVAKEPKEKSVWGGILKEIGVRVGRDIGVRLGRDILRGIFGIRKR